MEFVLRNGFPCAPVLVRGQIAARPHLVHLALFNVAAFLGRDMPTLFIDRAKG